MATSPRNFSDRDASDVDQGQCGRRHPFAQNTPRKMLVLLSYWSTHRRPRNAGRMNFMPKALLVLPE